VPQKPAEQSMVLVKVNPQKRKNYCREWCLLPEELILSPWIHDDRESCSLWRGRN